MRLRIFNATGLGSDRLSRTTGERSMHMERWHFFYERDFSSGYSWRWEWHCGDIIERSRTSFVTFLDCLHDAVQAGFDDNAVDILSNSIIVEVPSRGVH
jgi:hypothetical protein